MPPKAKVYKEQILKAGLDIVKTTGWESVNARNLAKALSCSTQPIFRIYRDMNEMKTDLFSFINLYCSKYLQENTNSENPFLSIAIAYIRFSKEEPNLFKALFMSNQITGNNIENMLVDEDNMALLNELSLVIQISFGDAQSLFQKMWLLAHGMASIIATNSNSFHVQEIEQILKDAFTGFVLQIKNGGQIDVTSK